MTSAKVRLASNNESMDDITCPSLGLRVLSRVNVCVSRRVLLSHLFSLGKLASIAEKGGSASHLGLVLP